MTFVPYLANIVTKMAELELEALLDTGPEIFIISKMDSPERQISSATSKRKQKKYRYKRQALQRCDKDEARRLEAKSFLTSITLDKFRSKSPYAAGSIEHDGIEESTSPSVLRRMQNTSVHPVEEGLVTTREQRLHEMAVDMFEINYHTPLKSSFSKSHEHDFEHLPPTALNFVSPMLRTVSQVDNNSSSASISHVVGVDPRKPPLTYSYSVGASTPQGAPDVAGLVHYCGTNVRQLRTNTRLVLTSSGSTFAMFSVLGYKKGHEKFHLEHPKGQRARLNSTSLHLELDTELGTNQEVSLTHLFVPLYLSPDLESGSTNLPSVVKKQSTFCALSMSYPDVLLEQSWPSSSGTSFPWAFFSEFHSVQDVLLRYHPLCMDNHEYFVGPHVSTLSVLSYTVSVIQYAKASEIKRGINKQFAETFPHVKISLSNLRSIKKDICVIARESFLDLSAVAYCYVYFEKLVMMGKVNKLNRKLIAGVCLLLAAKFFSDMKRHELKTLLEEIADTFHVSSEEVVCHELPVLASLQFALLTPVHQALHHYERLRDTYQ